jgi:hypothetical protein
VAARTPCQVATSWTDPSIDSVYTNVFTVSNYCSFAAYNLSKGDSIMFSIDGNLPAQTCTMCNITVPTPPVRNAVINVTKVPTP